MTTARDELTARLIPFMNLATPSQTPTPGTQNELTSNATATTRFAAPRSALLTGGTGALGTAVSHALLQHGLTHLTLLDLGTTSPASQTALAALRQTYPDAQIALEEVDVTDESAVAKAMSAADEAMNGIGALICTAGIVNCTHATDLEPSTFRKILDVNTMGSFICAQAAARQMIARGGGGRIVLTASVSAHRVNFPQPQVAYNVSKGALLMMAKSLAAEWAVHGIRVNTVSPGYLDTVLNDGDGLAEARDIWCSRTPVGRMGRVEEVAAIMLMLVSPAGSYITGADMSVDGGISVF